ncbi:pyroglutamyl-peptidase [Methylobacterium sp. BE186]|uniref:pyroglutamyl-peptidase I family protein n=1 Tax=Methylobacterium sp. BE186 TaxID=2817715 RepID=UPI00285C3FB8|nr:peptidase C15 [Methylobacterium sp. BE186]MDR7040254.1 pyroglutamyl-peptidase [Methylobacterium sp. BE186]
MTATLLVTGFGPFPGVPRNPSAALARRLGKAPRLRLALGGAPSVLVLRTAYDAIREVLAPALAEKPQAVLMFGVASRARALRVEIRARNRASPLFPDASGHRAGRLALDPAGPPERTSPAAHAAVAILRRHGIPVAASRDAGRYLCNASYFRALAEPCPVLFVHIPPSPRTRRPQGARPATDPQRTLRALAAVATMLTRRARRDF